MGTASNNPCRNVNVPKGEKREKQVYTLEETEQFFMLLEIAPLKYRLLFTLSIYSGFRNGEMLGLEWKDIDYKNNVISIHRTSNYTGEKGIYTDTTKTKRSMRSLKFSQFIMDMLKVFQAEQNTEKEKLGTKWEDSDRLFTKWNGNPMHPHTPYLWLKDFTSKHNFRFCDIHSFRHSTASILHDKGWSLKDIQEWLRHADIETTGNIYTHISQQRKQMTARDLEKTFII